MPAERNPSSPSTVPPQVSVCIPTCNGAVHLRETLESLAAQTYRDLEVIAVDDVSDDETLSILEGFTHPNFQLQLNRSRLGIPGNWNRSLALARGAYVQLLFQDDTLHPAAIERLVAALDAVPQAAYAFGRRRLCHEAPRSHGLPLSRGPYLRLLNDFYSGLGRTLTGIDLVRDALRRGRDLAINVVGEPSFVMMRASALRAVGPFDPAFAQLVDWEMWLRLARSSALAFVDEELGVFRIHSAGQSAANQHRWATAIEMARLVGRVWRSYGPMLTTAERRRIARQYVGRILRLGPLAILSPGHALVARARQWQRSAAGR
jgi:glycosyltransferase involved in cell wall biosynthesis